jgi:hypothetical protein
MAKTRTAEDDNFDPVGEKGGEPHVAELPGGRYEGVTAEMPDPATSGVTIETKTEVTAPSLLHLANHFNNVADYIEANNAGPATGRSTKAKSFAQGKAAGLREAATMVGCVKLTG